MPKKRLLSTTLVLGSMILAVGYLASCDKDQNPDHNKTMISQHDELEGHHFGENCMECHAQADDGEGWYTVAGTVVESDLTTRAGNGMVHLYSEPGGAGDLLLSVEVNKSGYFYTTQEVDLTDGYYVVVENEQGVASFMDTIAHFGSCNSCHNYNELPIYVTP